MAMTLDTAIKFTAKLEGQGLDQLKRGLQGLSQQSQVSKRSLDQLYTATKVLGSASSNTIAGLQKTATALRVLRDQAEFGSRKFKLLSSDIEAVEARLRRFQGTAAKTGGIGRGEALLAGVAGGVAAQLTQYAVQGAGAVVRVGIDAESARVRLKALTDEFGEYNQAQQATARIAQTLRLSTIEAQESFASFYASLRPTGVSIQEIEKAFIGFTAAARNSGATAQESAAALQQLKQALASGVLQGEEFRSIRQQAPLVAQAIAKEMGVSINALKELASQGEVTSDVVLRALAKLNETQLGKLNAQFDTGAQAIKDLSNAASELGTEVAKTFGPTAVALIRDFTRFLRDASNVWNSLFGGGDAAARQEEAVRARQQALQDAQRRFPNPFGFNTGERESYLRQREAQIRNRLATERVTSELKSDQLTPEQIRAQGAADKEREASRAAARKAALEDELKIRQDTEKKLADEAQQYQQQLADLRVETIKRAAELERDLSDQRLQIERDIAESRRRTVELEQDRALEIERQRLQAAGLSTEALDTQARLNEATRRFEEQKIKNQEASQDRQTQLQRRLEEFKTSVADSIGKLQEGYARSVSKILQDAGDKLAEKMVNGAQQAAGALGGGGALGPSSLRPGTVGGGQLNIGTLVGLAKAAGFNDRDARIMAAIAMAESGGGSGKLNNNPRTGDLSYGLWQVNMLGSMGPERRRQFGISNNAQLFDPATNAMAARRVYQSQGFGAWSVYRSGAYKQFLPGAMAAASGAPPAPVLPGAGGAAPGGFNSAGLMGGIQRAGQRLGAAGTALATQQNAQASRELVNSRGAEYTRITQALDDQLKSVRDQRKEFDRIAELQRSGLSPELAKQVANNERISEIAGADLQVLQRQLEIDLQRTDLTAKDRAELEAQLKTVQDRLAAQSGIVSGIQAEAQALEALQLSYEKNKQAIDGIANAIGSGLGQAFDLLATGTDNWGDSLKQIASGVLKEIAKQLFQIFVIDVAIAAIKGVLGGLSAGGAAQPSSLGQTLQGISSYGFANGGVMTGAGPIPLKKYARGGVANSPQMALFGEGSKPEAYVPLPDGRRIPVALQANDNGKLRDLMGGSPAAATASPVLNMSFQTTNIGGVEYVSRDQLEAAMIATRRQAARDGAKRGMSMTLDKLQQSPSTRGRVGIR